MSSVTCPFRSPSATPRARRTAAPSGLVLALALVAASCARSSGGAGGLAAPASTASVSTSSAARALAAYDAFLAAYWDPNTRNFFKESDHPLNVTGIQTLFAGQLYSDFWWEAHLLELTLDVYELTGSASDRAQIDAVYDGFVSMPWHGWMLNPYSDDLGWWALVLARAYEVTGEERFRDRAAAIFASIAPFEDATYGGGVWWKRDATFQSKNVCIGAPFALVAAHLYSWTGDPSYLDAAKRVHAWLGSRLVSGDLVLDNVSGTAAGAPANVQLTYNYGTWIGASLALADATGDPSYLADAQAAADHAMAALGANGILPDEGTGDCAGFKMILTRYLLVLARRGDARVASFLEANAASAWSNRRADGLMGEDWASPAPSGSILSFAAASAVDVQLHAALASRPPLASATSTTLGPFFAATVTADQAVLRSASLATASPGYTGSAYVAGLGNGGSATFTVSPSVAGEYTLVFRYAAGGGDVPCVVSVNGAPVFVFSLTYPMGTTLTFPATPASGDWRETSVYAYLPAGSTVISVVPSAGALDLDALRIAPSPAW
jgi:predicted alpha-1,6-mannanase (GH76 family)